MALKTLIPFPIFAPNLTPKTTTTTAPTTTEVRFSRWNNANAEKFNQQRRTQQQIEDDLRRHRRFDSALNIANFEDSQAPNFRSTGTPSKPSLSSIPGKKSKYSKTQNPNSVSHPAFRRVPRKTKLPQKETAGGEDLGEANLKIGEDGLSYVVPGAPFEFMYSYTETPKVKPLALREPPVVPFGLPRPWTGKKPFPPSKKKLPEFDSFTPPPANKKGVKPVQKPGPFLPGSGPKYVMSREEVLGEPLTDEEVKELIEGYRKSDRQLNMGRDGLTHNMLDNIHAHWKRRRVCKIKCKGVCTVDMDNVCMQLEEKSGGKIIYHRGGVVYLFRGRNYNYKTRPRFPLMLWKPVTPVYPRLIQHIPEGLTLEEATNMRKRGRELTPICKLGKNGVYVNLVMDVREAFEACELVRIDCQGLNPSDYRKIGAKLKELVPCVLISFENEHILMWRGRDWKPSILLPQDTDTNLKTSETDSGSLVSSDEPHSSNISIPGTSVETSNISIVLDEQSDASDNFSSDDVKSTTSISEYETRMIDNLSDENDPSSVFTQLEHTRDRNSVDDFKDETLHESSSSPLDSPCLEGVVGLLRQAMEDGSAVVLNDSWLDSDLVYERAVSLAQTAPPGPVFRCHPRKVAIQKAEKQETQNDEAKAVEVEVAEAQSEKKSKEKKSKGRKNIRFSKPEEFRDDYLNVVPQGSLKVDELAKLLA